MPGARERGGDPENPSLEGSVSQEAFLSSQAVLYARVSSKEQEREGYSIPAQRKLLRSYAQRQDYQVAREFVDVETAKQSGRIQFNRMVRFLRFFSEQ